MAITPNMRFDLMVRLGAYISSYDEKWRQVQQKAVSANPWFTSESVALAVANIASEFLQREKLEQWIKAYQIPVDSKTVGIVMAGNIPLVGFHDFLCGFISGHKMLIKPSSKDDILIKHLV